MVLPLRDPVLLAKQVASLDVLTEGRVILGIGVGWMREEFDALKVPFADRGKRAEEMVELMRRLWSGSSTSFSGKFFSLDSVNLHPTPVRFPPILWGGHSRATLRRVATHGDGWLPLGLSQPDFLEKRRELESMCVRAGRDPDSLHVCVSIGASEQLNSDLYGWYLRQGVQHLVCSLPTGDLDGCHRELRRIAVDCGLRERL
jgi:probable F420-dependent oxidoreductase